MPDIRTIVIDLCRRGGLDPERDLDVAALHGKLDGMVVDARGPVRGGLEPLLAAFAVDVAEADAVLRFLPRGNDPVAWLVEDDLVPVAQEAYGGQSALLVERAQQAEIPSEVEIVYRSRAIDWQRSTQTARRAASTGGGVRSVHVPLALGDGTARALVERMLYESWLGRDTYTFRLTNQFAWLDPGDVVMLSARGRTRRLRLVRTEADLLGLSCEAVLDDPQVLESSAAAAVPGVAANVLRLVAATRLFLLDLPALSDADGDGGFYAAASWSQAEGWHWPGAGLYRSDDGGGNFQPLGDLPGPAVWGTCATVLAPGPTAYWDEAASLTVVLNQGELEAASAPAVLNGANAALVGEEVLQFRNAVLVDEATYELSGLLRGRRGTEHAVAGHGADETFLLLRPYDLVRLGRGGERLGLAREYKAPTYGQALDDAAAVLFTNTGRALRPYSPARVRGARDGQSGDWTIRWARRARIGGAWRDGGDVPLDEAAERFEVDILCPEHDVLGTSAAESRFDIAGDWTALFVAGTGFTVTGNSQGNDGTYSVDSTQYLGTSDKTRLFTAEPVPADGGGGILTRTPRVVRTLSTTTPQALYSTLQQQADFGGSQTAVSVRVFQIGATGRGHPTETMLR